MKIRTRTDKICKMLKAIHPHVMARLQYRNPFELLVATILSAQCTDKQVNSVTKNLFGTLAAPDDFVNAPLEDIEKLIRSTGYFRNKAKNIQKCSKMLMEKYNGDVPNTMEELLKLPGVGRKTANVVLGVVFDIPGIVVDTHVKRISNRLGLTKNTDPAKIEFDLMKIIPQEDWNNFGLRLIYFGRAVCKARKPDCPNCPLCHLCEYSDKSA